MPLKTGRYYENADVEIDKAKCTLCGLCIKVCKGAPLFIEDKMVKVDHSRVFGCVACGQCMAVCPNKAIKVNGRGMMPEDAIKLPDAEASADYDGLLSLMLSRRSVRNYKNQDVSSEVISKIVEAAATAPNGLGSSDVELLIFDKKESVDELNEGLTMALKKYAWLFSPIMLKFFRPFMGKESYDSLRTFGSIATKTFIQKYEEGDNWLTYSAPMAILFHASPYADPVDPYIPATYAVLAAQSLGLGSCMLGVPKVILNYFGKDLRTKYKLPKKNKNGILVIFGYPEIKYSFSIKRRFASVRRG